jgi:hypothetical protein
MSYVATKSVPDGHNSPPAPLAVCDVDVSGDVFNCLFLADLQFWPFVFDQPLLHLARFKFEVDNLFVFKNIQDSGGRPIRVPIAQITDIDFLGRSS